MKTKIYYMIYDSRYLFDPEKAIVLEVCTTLKEAKENKDDYGDGNIIVKKSYKQITKKKYEIISSEIVN